MTSAHRAALAAARRKRADWLFAGIGAATVAAALFVIFSSPPTLDPSLHYADQTDMRAQLRPSLPAPGLGLPQTPPAAMPPPPPLAEEPRPVRVAAQRPRATHNTTRRAPPSTHRHKGVAQQSAKPAIVLGAGRPLTAGADAAIAHRARAAPVSAQPNGPRVMIFANAPTDLSGPD